MNKNKKSEESQPQYIEQQLHMYDDFIEERDPWVEPKADKDEGRGVVTINIAGNEDE